MVFDWARYPSSIVRRSYARQIRTTNDLIDAVEAIASQAPENELGATNVHQLRYNFLNTARKDSQEQMQKAAVDRLYEEIFRHI